LAQYHGGTNFGRTAGGPFIATSYDYDAPLDEFGMHFSFKFDFGTKYSHARMISIKSYVM